jgi:hypothetical protein
VNPALTPGSVEALGALVRERARTAGAHPHALVEALERRATELGVGGDAHRLRTAAAAEDLVARLAAATTSLEAIHAVAAVEVPTSDQALGSSIASAQRVRAALEDDRWTVLDKIRTARAAGADAVLRRLADALGRDEFAAPLEDAVKAAYEAAVGLLAGPAPTPAPAPAPNHTTGSLQRVTVREARAKLDSLPDGAMVDLRWTEP